jgi:hypothetical protein
MADEENKGGGPLSDLMFIVLGLVALAVLWFASGGPQKADLRGIFLQPPAPLGGGNAYGPQLGGTNAQPTTTQYESNTDYQSQTSY